MPEEPEFYIGVAKPFIDPNTGMLKFGDLYKRACEKDGCGGPTKVCVKTTVVGGVDIDILEPDPPETVHTPFCRDYIDKVVRLSAPATAGGCTFVRWAYWAGSSGDIFPDGQAEVNISATVCHLLEVYAIYRCPNDIDDVVRGGDPDDCVYGGDISISVPSQLAIAYSFSGKCRWPGGTCGADDRKEKARAFSCGGIETSIIVDLDEYALTNGPYNPGIGCEGAYLGVKYGVGSGPMCGVTEAESTQDKYWDIPYQLCENQPGYHEYCLSGPMPGQHCHMDKFCVNNWNVGCDWGNSPAGIACYQKVCFPQAYVTQARHSLLQGSVSVSLAPGNLCKMSASCADYTVNNTASYVWESVANCPCCNHNWGWDPSWFWCHHSRDCWESETQGATPEQPACTRFSFPYYSSSGNAWTGSVITDGGSPPEFLGGTYLNDGAGWCSGFGVGFRWDSGAITREAPCDGGAEENRFSTGEFVAMYYKMLHTVRYTKCSAMNNNDCAGWGNGPLFGTSVSSG